MMLVGDAGYTWNRDDGLSPFFAVSGGGRGAGDHAGAGDFLRTGADPGGRKAGGHKLRSGHIFRRIVSRIRGGVGGVGDPGGIGRGVSHGEVRWGGVSGVARDSDDPHEERRDAHADSGSGAGLVPAGHSYGSAESQDSVVLPVVYPAVHSGWAR